QNIVVQRFSIHCADSLVVAPLLFPSDAVDAELIKARKGEFENGFDFLVGNPPYVRHDESESIVSYLGRIEKESWFETKHMKWDLYVPFVEQYLRLLADSPNARCCLVTIESLGTAPYASKLRAKLTEQATVHRVLFTEKLELFADAKWQDNIVFTFSRGRPPAQHIVERQIARGFADDGSIASEALDQLTRDELAADRVFNRRDQVTLDLSKTALLEELCYVSKGMVLHANERLAKNETIAVSSFYDPARFGEEIVEDLGTRGKRIRHKSFTRDDLVADHRDELHSRRYLGSREVKRGGLGPVRWIEFGEAARCPSRVDRPTFPELFERPKVMFGEFTGIAVDSGGEDGFIIVSHAVNVAVRWCLLADIENRSIAKAKRALGNRLDASRSSNLSEWYLCALTQSEPIQCFLQANKRSMKEHVYPEDIKSIPIKLLPPKQQRPFIDLAKRRHRLWDEITALESRGFDKKARQVTQLYKQIEKINADLDRLAWRLYRPRKDKAARDDD
ncbi:MAG TPA: Eco57I restriction-modification methylase domain-containing protein, partial [Polyangium sp.]|nr:Eco57I restriction-modification methylase domain-containing protein [Polyangium sp.]